MASMAQPILHHRSPEYEALFVEVRGGLKRLFQTSQDVLPFAYSGTGVMEASIANTLSAGDEVLLIRAGKFADNRPTCPRAFAAMRSDPGRGHVSPLTDGPGRLRAHLSGPEFEMRESHRRTVARIVRTHLTRALYAPDMAHGRFADPGRCRHRPRAPLSKFYEKTDGRQQFRTRGWCHSRSSGRAGPVHLEVPR